MRAIQFKPESLSPEIFWYLVGLIVSDGSLSVDKRHIDITSKDYRFLKSVKKIVSLPQKINIKSNGRKSTFYRIQIGSVILYQKLLSIGLTPNKSKKIGSLKIANSYFNDFLRGVIDGDGGFRRWYHSANLNEQWSLRITSGSEQFLIWLQRYILKFIGVKGKIYYNSLKGHEAFVIKFGKMAAIKICGACYVQKKNLPKLTSKYQLAMKCYLSRKKGWKHSKTVILNKARVVE